MAEQARLPDAVHVQVQWGAVTYSHLCCSSCGGCRVCCAAQAWVALSQCRYAAVMRLVVPRKLSPAAAVPHARLLRIALIQAYVQRCVGVQSWTWEGILSKVSGEGPWQDRHVTVSFAWAPCVFVASLLPYPARDVLGVATCCVSQSKWGGVRALHPVLGGLANQDMCTGLRHCWLVSWFCHLRGKC